MPLSVLIPAPVKTTHGCRARINSESRATVIPGGDRIRRSARGACGNISCVSEETIGQRLRRLRREHGLSQRDLASPGISYAYISRIEADARVPSVKALRKIAGKLGVTVEHLEIGEPTPTERGVADAGVDFETLTDEELRAIRARAATGAREAARLAALDVIETRRQTEMEQLRKRLEELERRTTPKRARPPKGGSRSPE
jgi:transcriptional regulator with XRE-family HTH domain